MCALHLFNIKCINSESTIKHILQDDFTKQMMCCVFPFYMHYLLSYKRGAEHWLMLHETFKLVMSLGSDAFFLSFLFWFQLCAMHISENSLFNVHQVFKLFEYWKNIVILFQFTVHWKYRRYILKSIFISSHIFHQRLRNKCFSC